MANDVVLPGLNSYLIMQNNCF